MSRIITTGSHTFYFATNFRVFRWDNPGEVNLCVFRSEEIVHILYSGGILWSLTSDGKLYCDHELYAEDVYTFDVQGAYVYYISTSFFLYQCRYSTRYQGYKVSVGSNELTLHTLEGTIRLDHSLNIISKDPPLKDSWYLVCGERATQSFENKVLVDGNYQGYHEFVYPRGDNGLCYCTSGYESLISEDQEYLAQRVENNVVFALYCPKSGDHITINTYDTGF